ncbi:anhydro-N-acetylmuramic acid kinase [Polaribacter glomeratus]|uniref:Anhydro-N-acetylmuramic acid kinase n=1 Tax=Polaribacter glomeratus TaxID=102 RepID=A0A2S7WTZ3_9FLAO|nr:anhydro-N-acetylmuramic acid kinase [Polaribacter glomeratus]PQJ81073.1 anhydro-N-acetylmuramic acid kinase [Polaribacter glomeratus]TXD63787.1 anhydro-N-acetylmuramic acid kinase [Polaribacter glomeratus]
MNKNEVFCIGLMSGTSLDGIDLVYVKFDKNKYSDFEIIFAETFSYTDAWKNTLQKGIHFSSDELIKLNLEYGALLGNVLLNFINTYKIQKIDFIASHGHTILHQPAKGITLQIGDGQTIANATKQKVVCDFRTQDVQLGGQGAPLVPIGDALLFSDFEYCLNLGGFSNVSFHKDAQRIAFDICPVNIVLNFYANKLGFDFDASGTIASQGKINETLLERLNSLAFYQQKPPKSLGLEWVQEEIFPLIDALETAISSILRTFVEHVAIQISKIIYESNSVLITGGGVFNSFLIERIEYHSKTSIVLADKKRINFKEALIFAFLGLLKLDNQVNCLKSVTGARKNHSSGVVFYPKL